MRKFPVWLAALLVFSLALVGLACGGESEAPTSAPITTAAPTQASTAVPPATPTPEQAATLALAPIATLAPEPSATLAPAPTSTPSPTAVPVVAPTATPVPASTTEDNPLEVGDAPDRVGRLGYSSDPGTLSPYVKPAEIDGSGRKLLAIYMVASDLEEDAGAGTTDFQELIEGYVGLPNNQVVEVIVAFGGADKDGWRGMKFANISQLMADAQDQEFGNETGSGAYLYQADGAHMGDESSLGLFLDYLRDGYVNFDQKFLTFWDHGNSYKGFGNDTNFNSDPLYLDEMDWAFQRSQPGSFDLIGFDACLMATVEVAKTVKSIAKYMIASEETEPGHGWLWSAVIQQYAQQDTIVEAGKRIIDNFVQDVHQYEAGGKTLSLLDLSEYDRLVAALNPVVSAFGQQLLSSDEYSDSVIFGSTRAQAYGASERENSRASIDLRHFTQLLAEKLPNDDISPSLNELMAAIDRFVVHSNQDGSRSNSFGIAIDAPENTDADSSAYKVNDTWLGFQSAYSGLLLSDTIAPVVVASDINTDPQSLQLDPDVADQFSDSEGTVATFNDENLTKVTTIYGFVEPIEFEDGAVEEFFMIVAELEAYPTETEGEYFTPPWDKWWFTVEYDLEEFTAWIPASFNSFFEEDGQFYTVYTAEIDYYQADKDYSGYEFPADFATMTLIVDEFMEVVDYYIQTYKFMFSGPEDEEGTVQIDKATLEITPGDAVQFWNFGFNLEDETKDDWFEASDVVTFAQEPFFLLEFLEFEDEFGQLIEYQYAMWAEDVSGNGILTELVTAALE